MTYGYAKNTFKWAEDWIEKNLRRRLFLYKRKYPGFNLERFIEQLTRYEADSKTQRWWPYMKDEDIAKMNKLRRKVASYRRSAKRED
jgi:hypothetical protein